MITVVIPTYDRRDNLKILIQWLVQYNEKFEIIIFNNDPRTKIDKLELVDASEKRKIKVINTRIHFGPDASLLHGMQLARTEYIYLLGDSKIPDKEVFIHFYNEIENGGFDTLVFSHKSNLISTQILDFKSLHNDNIHIGDLFLGGSTIIKREFFELHFSKATQLTLARSVLLTFNILAIKYGRCKMTNKVAIHDFLDKPKHYDPELSLLECWGQFPLVNRLDLSHFERKLIERKLKKMEGLNEKIILIKFSLIQIFRHKKDITYHLKFIQKNRNLFSFSFVEFLILFFLRIVSRLMKVFILCKKKLQFMS